MRLARMYFVVQPPSRFLKAEVFYEFVAQDSILVWDFGRGLRETALSASFPIREVVRDTTQQTLTIMPGQPIEGQRHWIRAAYQGEPASSGFGSFEVKAHETGYVLWTLSQPYGARDWLLCQNDLSDKVDTLFISIETPPDYIGVANGRLLADSLTAHNTRLRHFAHHYPIATYLIAIAASNYAIQTHTISTPFHNYTLTNYVFPQDTARARTLTEQIRPYFSWIEEKLGPYPFAEEGYAQVQIGWGGGMEHQTITFFGTYSLELWAHELAHQWFGDLVTCGSWQDIWLNEAFATLLGGKVYELLPTGLWPRWRYLTILAAWRDTANTIFVPDTANYQRIFSYPTTYAKGAIALETLREFLNDEPFWQGLRRYLGDYRYGLARTADFARSVRPIWGSVITNTFLQSWIYTPGFPEAALLWEAPGRITIHPKRPYPMRVPVHIHSHHSDSVKVFWPALLGAEEITFSTPAIRVVIDPDTTTPYYRPRAFLPPGQPPMLYPNPTHGPLNILYPRPPYRLLLYDGTGKVYLHHILEGSAEQISLSSFPAGLYHLLVETEGEVFHEKVIKVSP